MKERLIGKVAMAAAAPAMIALGVFVASPAGASGPGAQAVWVSSHGTDSTSCGSPANPCRTISQGVANASTGQTVVVRPGTYAEHVQIDKQVDLEGHDATIDASGSDQGIWVLG